MSLSITLTANTGVILQSENCCVLIDALHNEKTSRFSSVSEADLLRVRERFTDKHPDLVLVTHLHPDHCSANLIRQFAQIWTDTVFLLPDNFPEERVQSRLGEIEFTSIALPHDGSGYENTVLRGYCVSLDGKNILHIGDGALSAGEEIMKLVNGRRINSAIMNFPWVTLSSGKEFLENTLKPDHLFVSHLPFDWEDTEGFRKAAYMAAESVRLPDVRVLGYPMQEEWIF